MSHNDLSQENYIDTTAQSDVVYSTRNYATLGLSISGTITTGTFTVEGTEDGYTWQELPVAQGNVQLAGDEITAVGSYIVGVAGYALVRLVPDNFTGSLRIMGNISTRITPAFTIGIG